MGLDRDGLEEPIAHDHMTSSQGPSRSQAPTLPPSQWGLCAGTLLLRAGFLSDGEQGLFFIAVRGLLGVVVSPAEEHRL